MRVLGIEGTAWAASAAIFDTEQDIVAMETAAYTPDSGGLHPREAAEHMADHLPAVVEAVISDPAPTASTDTTPLSSPTEPDSDRRSADPDIDAIAFSRGPGLGPCLRLVGTTARALAQRFDVPLVGVNHMIAHLEVGRHYSGFDDPICLNASGANAHVLGYRGGRYRILGETMDTGVGNAIDKFTRHIGWSHPGGPKVEEAARDGDYLELPYVVKGMDFSFAGISSAAQSAYDEGESVEDICCGLQETIFAMLSEVSERALALTDRDELVLGGGVGQNERLQEMLTTMCDQRGASVYAPPDHLLRDNAGMIAILGAKMVAADSTLALSASSIDADFRPDQVTVTWRDDDGGPVSTVLETDGSDRRGAEAVVDVDGDRVVKHRISRAYRHPRLDERIRRERTRAESRLLHAARRAGVPTPLLSDIDLAEATLTMQSVGDRELRQSVSVSAVRTVGELLARLHQHGIVHGDPTTRNIRIDADRDPADSNWPTCFLIDFGLGYYSDAPEDHAMDLHVFSQTLEGTCAEAPLLREELRAAYESVGELAVIDRLDEIETRGRYQ